MPRLLRIKWLTLSLLVLCTDFYTAHADEQDIGQLSAADGTMNLAAGCLPLSICTNNFPALTPAVEPSNYRDKGYGYLLDWPGYTKGTRRDKFGKVFPAFHSRTSGAGVWWYWMLRRAWFQPDQKLTILDVAKKYAGFDDENHPKTQQYITGYIAHSAHYFGKTVSKDDPIDLSNHESRWHLAMTMFHHEAGRKVSELTRSDFEAGVLLAEKIIYGD